MDRFKGSYKRMRELVCKENTKIIENKIKDSVIWICPQEGDYKEYQLNGKGIIKKLGLPDGLFDDFWPKRAPQWDGLFIASSSKTLYLIEAKSYLNEITKGNYAPKSSDSNYETKLENYNIKCNSLRKLLTYFNVDTKKEEYWLHKYYQIANRIAFFLKIKESLPNNIIQDVKLLFLNFVNDPDWKKENKHASNKDWNKKYTIIIEDLGLTWKKLSKKGVCIWNVDIGELSVEPFCPNEQN